MGRMTRKEQIEAMLRETPDDPFLHYGLAMEFVSAGNDAAAIERFRTLLAIDADYVPAYLQAGQALVRTGRQEEARNTLMEGIKAAKRKGDDHALGEMQGFLDGLD
jgi:Flp pilus assembly protein TadD